LQTVQNDIHMFRGFAAKTNARNLQIVRATYINDLKINDLGLLKRNKLKTRPKGDTPENQLVISQSVAAD